MYSSALVYARADRTLLLFDHSPEVVTRGVPNQRTVGASRYAVGGVRSILPSAEERGEGGARRGLQSDGFREHALTQVGREGLLSDHVYWTINEILQILLEAHEIQERAAFSKGHEEVEIAVLASFTPSQGTEDSHVPRSMAHRQFEDFRAIPFQEGADHTQQYKGSSAPVSASETPPRALHRRIEFCKVRWVSPIDQDPGPLEGMAVMKSAALKLVFVLALASIILGGSSVSVPSAEAHSHCLPGVVCPTVYQPVICENGQVYMNICFANKDCQKDCKPFGDSL